MGDHKINNNGGGSLKKTPLLFFLGELSGETRHVFIDPIDHKFNIIHPEELEGQAECLASRYGWLLVLSRETTSLFFFNPITRQRINLPYRNRIINAAAFSAPPTSPNCTVFLVETSTFIDGQFRIDTFLVGQESWDRHVYSFSTKTFSNVVQAVCSNGVLYCVDSHGRIGTFDGGKYKNNWNIIPTKVFERVWNPYLVEFNGEVFAGKKGAYGVIEKVYKLKIDDGFSSWKEEELGDVTFFLGPYGSCAMLGLNQHGMKKRFYASDYGLESFSWWYTPIWLERSTD